MKIPIQAKSLLTKQLFANKKREKLEELPKENDEVQGSVPQDRPETSAAVLSDKGNIKNLLIGVKRPSTEREGDWL